MKRSRFIYYIIFASYHLILFLFTYYVDTERGDDFVFLLDLLHNLTNLKYAFLIGLVLVIIDAIWDWQELRQINKEKERTQQEVNVLKAKLFDIQEENKHPVTAVEKKDDPAGE